MNRVAVIVLPPLGSFNAMFPMSRRPCTLTESPDIRDTVDHPDPASRALLREAFTKLST